MSLVGRRIELKVNIVSMPITRGNIVKIFGVEISSNEFIFRKKLFRSDIDRCCRLAIPKKAAQQRLLKYLTADEMRRVNGEGIIFRVLDFEGEVEETFVLKHWGSSKTYVILQGWIEFVKRRSLNVGHTIEFWRDTVNARFVMSCSTASSSGVSHKTASSSVHTATEDGSGNTCFF